MALDADRLRLLLARGPVSARGLMDALGVSQPTLSRALAGLGDELLRLGSARSIQYVLRDRFRGIDPVPVYRVDALGQLVRLGVLAPCRPDGFVMQQDDGKSVHSEGWPWWLQDMRPQGFLGRTFAEHHAARLGLPTQLAEWTDAHALRALLVHGHDATGHLLLGDLARAQFLAQADEEPLPLADKGAAYAVRAQQALQGAWPGSSAAGEQPKFTAFAHTPDGPCHVLVKFSLAPAPQAPNPVAQRWRDLLLAEHHALQTLRAAGLQAASSWVHDHGAQRFLEVARFDRVGVRGRCGVASLAVLDGEFVGQARAPWPVLVAALAQQKRVTAEALDATQRLFAMGRLIGNTDMHAGNLSFVLDAGPPYALAPAYDMLPMAFAPGAGGVLPHEMPPADLHASVPNATWRCMLDCARAYLDRLQAEPRFSDDFAPCLAALARHVDTAATQVARLGA